MSARHLTLLPALALAALLTGCPATGIVCRDGTIRCGQGCVDIESDQRNCGACGIACQTGQVCQSHGCVCQAGATLCNGQCAVLGSDPDHCGSCTKACATDQLCQQGACVKDCTAGGAVPTRCGNSCVSLETDPAHCGSCGATCENSQSCHAGKCTYDLVAACFGSGQVRGLQGGSAFVGPLESLGTGPAALAAWDETLLAVDGLDRRLNQARLKSVDGHAFAPYRYSNKTGAVPNQILVAPPYVYVINSQTGTLQVLQSNASSSALPDGGGLPILSDAGTEPDGGLALTTVAEHAFGPNTYPQVAVKVGNFLWVPLYGGFGASGAAVGQKVVRVDISDPLNPTSDAGVDLAALDLHAFDGGSPVARPYAIAASGNQLFVALNNLNPDTYVPEGPGLLAKIDATTLAVSVIDLGADKCLNPVWLVTSGTNVVVACAGAANYDFVTYALTSVDKAGVVVVDLTGARQSSWTSECPVDAGLADGGSSCAPILPSRFTLQGDQAWLGDQNGGRIFVLDVGDGGMLTERRGYAGSAGGPIQACVPDSITGIANVSDVLAVP